MIYDVKFLIIFPNPGDKALNLFKFKEFSPVFAV